MQEIMKFLIVFMLLIVTPTFLYAQVAYETSGVERVGSSFVEDKICVYLDNGNIVRLDITTEIGKAELSIVLAAQVSGKEIRVAFKTSEELLAGCNSGTTIQPHAILTIQP